MTKLNATDLMVISLTLVESQNIYGAFTSSKESREQVYNKILNIMDTMEVNNDD